MIRQFLMVIMVLGCALAGNAQTDEAAQLLLNVEKLAQFKQILSDLKKGYEVVSKGYSTVKDLSEGNFSLHKTFLDALLQVSPGVRKYKRVADIIAGQIALVKESKEHFTKVRNGQRFSLDEINYIDQVYGNLLKEGIRNIEDLTTILTANQLRMSDDERFKAIDQIYSQMQDKLSFLRSFNNKTSILALQKAKESRDIQGVKNSYGIK
ncbi:TerB family tellurite resistance protein [Pedobacter frigoris]|uniref:TerB family tellurite resistance protein n=1 Tax=Pedobacter frigoris TaxID=2571272 RepID=UPI002931CAC8|nr:TerB family tellurite resistance protein [Pedobacter frigoris]